MKDLAGIIDQIKNKKIIIYGATIGGKIICQSLELMGVEVFGFCDLYKYNQLYSGRQVIHPKELRKIDDKIVVVALTRSLRSAEETLNDLDIRDEVYHAASILKEKNINDFSLSNHEILEAERFIDKYGLYLSENAEEIVFPTLEVFVTNRCTLRCKHCSHLIPYYSQKNDLDIDEVIASIKKMLKVVGCIKELYVLGGEPLLHPEVGKLVKWCANNNQIAGTVILTNGTIIPNEKLFGLFRESNVKIRISNYGGLSSKKSILLHKCGYFSIPVFMDEYNWVNLGNGEFEDITEEQAVRRFVDCPFSVEYLLIDGKLFRCAHGAHMQRLNLFDFEETEYVDLLDEKIDLEELYVRIKKFLNLKNIRACKYCKGFDLKNVVEPAIQIGDNRNEIRELDDISECKDIEYW